LTTDAVERQLRGRHQTISARVHELEQDGFIEDSKLRRKTSSGHPAIVYRPTSKGLARVLEEP
jgi:DNA-binding PadR family transcriptional regulator